MYILAFHFKTHRVAFIYNSVIYISLHNWKINAYLSKVKDFKYLKVLFQLFIVSKKETKDKNFKHIGLPVPKFNIYRYFVRIVFKMIL